jgi:glycosyltransferase involved in cell wall biosynthesis
VKILNLATSLSGGAGIAALRSHNALVREGVNSSLLTNRIDSPDNSVNASYLEKSALKEFVSSGITLTQRLLIQNSDDLITPVSFGRNVLTSREFEEANVIHVHAFYNLLSLSSISGIINSGKKLLITLHDERMFTGGCHYSRNCEGFINVCKRCPQATILGKKFVSEAQNKSIQLFSSNRNVQFIAPSYWIKGKASRSAALKNCKIDVIRNPIPQVFFDSASVNKIEKDRVKIGFISQNIENPYKGIDVMISALNSLPDGLLRKIELFLIGKTRKSYENDSYLVTQISVESDEHMAKLLNRLNFVVIPSSEDNFPSVIGETLASGTRVIGSNVGGIAEAMVNFKLPRFKSNNFVELAKMIELEMSEPREIIDLNKVEDEFSEKVYAQKMLKLYRG